MTTTTARSMTEPTDDITTAAPDPLATTRRGQRAHTRFFWTMLTRRRRGQHHRQRRPRRPTRRHTTSRRGGVRGCTAARRARRRTRHHDPAVCTRPSPAGPSARHADDPDDRRGSIFALVHRPTRARRLGRSPATAGVAVAGHCRGLHDRIKQPSPCSHSPTGNPHAHSSPAAAITTDEIPTSTTTTQPSPDAEESRAHSDTPPGTTTPDHVRTQPLDRPPTQWSRIATAICERDPARRRDPSDVAAILSRHYDHGQTPTQISHDLHRSRSAISRIISDAAPLRSFGDAR